MRLVWREFVPPVVYDGVLECHGLRGHGIGARVTR